MRNDEGVSECGSEGVREWPVTYSLIAICSLLFFVGSLGSPCEGRHQA